MCEKSWRFPSFFKYGTSSYILDWAVWKERPGERWMFPMTLFTRTRPATLQPSDDCSWIWSDQCSSTHYSSSESARHQHEGRKRQANAPGQSPQGCQNSSPSACTTPGRHRTSYSIRPRAALRHSTTHNTRPCVARSTYQCRCGARRLAHPGRPFLQP